MILGNTAALSTAVLWSISSYAFSSASNRIGAMQLNVDRIIIASFFLLLIVLFGGYEFNLLLSQFAFLIISGIIGLVIGDSFLFAAFKEVGARVTIVLTTINPAIAAIIAYFVLSENISILGILGMSITSFGILLVILKSREQKDKILSVSSKALFYGFMASLCQATGLILAKFAFNQGEISGFEATFVRVFSSMIVIIPMMTLLKRYRNPIKVYKENFAALKYVLIGSIFGPVLGITLSLIAIKNTDVGLAATLMSTTPIIMLPIAKYYNKEVLSWRTYIGTFLAVIGVALIFINQG